MKHKCDRCGKKFPRMDVWNVGKVTRKLVGYKNSMFAESACWADLSLSYLKTEIL